MPHVLQEHGCGDISELAGVLFGYTVFEAMVMEKPLFKCPIAHSIAMSVDHAHYFDPLSPACSTSYRTGFPTKRTRPNAPLKAAREHAINFSSPRKRAEKYLELLSQSASELKNV